MERNFTRNCPALQRRPKIKVVKYKWQRRPQQTEYEFHIKFTYGIRHEKNTYVCTTSKTSSLHIKYVYLLHTSRNIRTNQSGNYLLQVL